MNAVSIIMLILFILVIFYIMHTTSFRGAIPPGLPIDQETVNGYTITRTTEPDEWGNVYFTVTEKGIIGNRPVNFYVRTPLGEFLLPSQPGYATLSYVIIEGIGGAVQIFIPGDTPEDNIEKTYNYRASRYIRDNEIPPRLVENAEQSIKSNIRLMKQITIDYANGTMTVNAYSDSRDMYINQIRKIQFEASKRGVNIDDSMIAQYNKEIFGYESPDFYYVMDKYMYDQSGALRTDLYGWYTPFRILDLTPPSEIVS